MEIWSGDGDGCIFSINTLKGTMHIFLAFLDSIHDPDLPCCFHMNKPQSTLMNLTIKLRTKNKNLRTLKSSFVLLGME